MTIPVAPEPQPLAPPPVAPAPVAPPRRRRPVFGGIAFALVVVAYLAAGGIVIYAYTQTQDAFIQGPPWWALTSQLAALPLGILSFLGLVLGIIGTARREKPGWPAISAMIFSLPAFGYIAFAAYVWFTVIVACSTPPGACGV